MGNITGGASQEIPFDPIDTARLYRDTANRVLIVGAGAKCAHMDNEVHDPHPHGALTLDLPPEQAVNYQMPSHHGDITDTAIVGQVFHHAMFDFIHFENVDTNVCASAGAIASAHALLNPGGTLFIETGGIRPQETVAPIQRLLELLGFTNIFVKTTNGVQIVAKKGSGLSNVRLHTV
jgi:hypothetical protein